MQINIRIIDSILYLSKRTWALGHTIELQSHSSVS